MLSNLDTVPRHYTPTYYKVEKEHHEVPEPLKQYLTDLGFDSIFKSVIDEKDKNEKDSDTNEKTRREIILDDKENFGDVLSRMFGSGGDNPPESDGEKNKIILVGYNSKVNNTLEICIPDDTDGNMSLGDYLVILDEFKPHLKEVFQNDVVNDINFTLIFINANKSEKMKSRGIYAAVGFDIDYFVNTNILNSTIVAYSKGDVKRMVFGCSAIIRSIPSRINFICKHGKTLD